jgi:succinoglycan biosynthesis transport protein ExoP
MRELAPHYSHRPVPRFGQGTSVITEPMTEEEEVLLQDHWHVIRKRLRLILTTLFSTVLMVGVVLFVKTPIYTATVTLLIERQSPHMLDIRAVLAPELVGPDEYDYYQTQFEILKSQSLAAEVIREQGLEKDGRFAGEKREWFVSSLRKQKRLGVSPKIIDAYLGSLVIDPVPRTRLVKVSFSTSAPELSARVANAHAQAYISQGLELHIHATREAERYLDQKLVELRKRVQKSEAALNVYRRDKGILSLSDKENIVVERLTDLNNRVTEAEAERIGLEAQAGIIRNRDYDSLPAVINSTLIQTLKAHLARQEEDYASLSSQFTPRYSRMGQSEAQVEETRRRLKQEIQRVVEGIESAYLAAEAKEKELRAKMEEQKAAAFGLKDASVEYGILAREVDTNSQLYDSVLQRIKEMEVATEGRISNVSVIDKAVPPLRPSEPKKLFDLGLSALVGLMGGLGLAFLLEHFDNTLKTPQEVERYLRLPNLGAVPDFASIDPCKYIRDALPNASPPQLPVASLQELILSQRPRSTIITEAYRTLHTNILLSRAAEPAKTLLFTSSTQGEGKTLTALNTAVMFTQMGARVLMIDADLRHSSCHKVLGATNALGLTEVLTGQRELQEMIRPLATPPLFLLTSGSRPPNPVALLGSKKMLDILASLREHYDYILIDSPPVMPVADAVLLSAMVDGVVLVVNSQETPNYIVRETRARLTYARANVLGVVLNQVNMRSGDYAYYYRHYCSYPDSPEEETGGTAKSRT